MLQLALLLATLSVVMQDVAATEAGMEPDVAVSDGGCGAHDSMRVLM